MLVVMVGLPGSGKSTYARAHFVGIVSPDDIRLARFGTRFDREHEEAVWREAYAETAARLGRAEVVCFDATSVTRRRRRMLLALAHNAQRPAVAIYMDLPQEVAWERNAARAACVPRPAFVELVRALDPPALDEGFAAISIVRPAAPEESA